MIKTTLALESLLSRGFVVSGVVRWRAGGSVIGDLGRGQASKLLKEVADGDDVAYVLRYGKPLVVVISHERYERLMEDGVDPNEH